MAIGMKPSNNETKDSTNKVESLVDKNVKQKSNKNTIIIIAVVAVIVIIIIAMLKSLMTPEESIEMSDTGQIDGTTQETVTTTTQGVTTEHEISTEVTPSSTKDRPTYVRIVVKFPAEIKARSFEEVRAFSGRYLVYQIPLGVRVLQEEPR